MCMAAQDPGPKDKGCVPWDQIFGVKIFSFLLMAKHGQKAKFFLNFGIFLKNNFKIT